MTLATMVPTCSTPTNKRRGPRWRTHAPGDGVASYVAAVAQRHGMRPATLHALIHGKHPLPELLREVMAEAIREGKRDRVLPWFDLLEATARGMASPLSNALITQAVIADEDENVVRDAFLLSRSPATRKRWRRAIEIERTMKLELWMAL